MTTPTRARVIITRSMPVAPEPRVEKCAAELGNAGYFVSVLAWDREGTSPLSDERKDFSIIRFRLKAPFGRITMLFYLPFWWFFLCLQLLVKKYDVAHACDLDTVLPALIIGKIKRKKLVFDIFDSYSGRMSSWVPRPVVAIVEWLEKFATQSADAVIVTCENLQTELLQNAYVKRSIIIHNSPRETISGVSSSRAGHRFVVFFGGYISAVRGIQYVAEAIKDLRFVTFVVAGFGEKAREIERMSANTPNIVFLGKISHEQIIERTREADLIVALYDPSWGSHRKGTSANKLMEAMMCRKPVLTSEGIAMGEFVREKKCGVVVEYGNVQQIRESIVWLKDNPELRRQLGENGYQIYEKNYSWEIMKSRLLGLYRSVAHLTQTQ